ncbi:BlaI/MecI/CopY family transcriptional regulator [bacterium]|nr:BlaI/MecI/CopY family transcriptional regulator [bacterium]
MADKKASHAETQLGPLQRQVLEYVWDNPGCTARDCVDAFNSQSEKQYAYTTIKTVFDVLHKKKLVSRRRTKTAYHYLPRQSRAGLLKERLSDLFSRFRGDAAPVASSLVDALQEDDPEQLKALIAELKERGHIK